MFNKVLIANRGAIAVRVIRSLTQMGIDSVAVYAQADRDSLHVGRANEAFCLGEGNANTTYLDQEKILAICKQSGAQAVHPGYGFLSENADFVTLCESNGIAFLGPTAGQINCFGLKHKARDLALNNAVPLLPGSSLLDSIDKAIDAASTVGFPLMLKSTAGGGGIGMQLCHDEQQLRAAFDSVKRLSENNFGNADVFLERFIVQARHIEVQIFGDGNGQVIALGERDCSTQRRNQKVIEETPAPNLPDDVRTKMHATAIQLGKTVNYRSAGTVEYIYDPQNQRCYFLEVNTRLQVEHGVTEEVFGVDIVDWMVRLGADELGDIVALRQQLQATGHALQVRLYAEDPGKNFQPSAGLLTQVIWPDREHHNLRIDHWIEAGVAVPPLFDPMLAKLIVHDENRQQAIAAMQQALADTQIYGVETNQRYLIQILADEAFRQGEISTRYLNSLAYAANTFEVLAAGTQTSVQDWPGRVGYWHVGVPPSGPFDSYSFRLGNRLLGNPEDAAGLEMTLTGPTLKFNTDCTVVITGAELPASVHTAKGDSFDVALWQPWQLSTGDVLQMGKTGVFGARAYLLIAGGIATPHYLDSRSTFTLGQLGGHGGRALRIGDVLHLGDDQQRRRHASQSTRNSLPPALIPHFTDHWKIHVIYGPHGAPDFFTQADIAKFFAASWEVHYNSSRTGIRLIGPKPQWARSDGGEAGMHPSNIHDNAYALGSVDFTGDMPVILGPDGPSLGGFVCPATVVTADLWKLGQLKAGDRVNFVPVSVRRAVHMEDTQNRAIAELRPQPHPPIAASQPDSAIVKRLAGSVAVVYRPCGDHYLLVEYGPAVLDINLRFRVHTLMLWLQQNDLPGLRELTPGIRSLQIHYDSQQLDISSLLQHLEAAEAQIDGSENRRIDSRIVWLPLSWDDEACHRAVEKYQQSVRKEAPWCPDNLEFIRRINGLDSVSQVKDIVFDASYVVMGLGDVYLGAPVATPLDPRHRLVTTKYNPARTWTAENSVGIGGSYLCVYGMEGPGGYQFIGRTLQMWNRYRTTAEFSKPWLLRFFDQIRFYEVSSEELNGIRENFPKGAYPLKIEQTTFSLVQHNRYIEEHKQSIEKFTAQRDAAFASELARWVNSGQMNYHTESGPIAAAEPRQKLPENCITVNSEVAGSIWKLAVKPGDDVKSGQLLLVIESMKMEIEVLAPRAGTIHSIAVTANEQVNAGQQLLVLNNE